MALWENVIGYGTHADRPAGGAPGAVYCESDTGKVYRDNGTGWDLVATSAVVPRTVLHISADTVLPHGNLFVVVTGGTPVITLPDPVPNVGQSISIKLFGGGLSNIVNPDTTDADHHTDTPWNGISDGVQWLQVDF